MAISQSTDRFNGYVASLAFKVPCVTVATTNITLSGPQTIAGILVGTGDRVLVAGQTDPIENGIYLVTSSAWNRAPDFDGRRDATTHSLVTVARSGVQSAVIYQVDTAVPFIIGEGAVNFSIFLDPDAGFGAHVLNSHTDVVITTPSDVNALFYDTGNWVNRPITESDISNLQTYLTDAVSDGSTYGRNNGAWVAVSAGATQLTDLTDVWNSMSPSNGEIFVYNTALTAWRSEINYKFVHFAIAPDTHFWGTATVNADNNDDTLTFVGGVGITVESDVDFDAIRITADSPAVTHTGEVTGDTSLTLDVTAVTNRTDVVADAADDVTIHDDSDGTLKKVNLSSITDGGYF